MLSNTDKKTLLGSSEAERLYQIYKRVQSGEKDALSELFGETNRKQICRSDEMNREYRLLHMDNVLDSELVLDREKNIQEKEWLGSSNSKVIFQFPCLNKMLYKKKKYFLSKAKNTGYENGRKKQKSGHKKFYEGEYDISDFNELMYETVIEIFTSRTDENNCLTLDSKRNERIPICDGISLLKNISYFTSRKINKRAEGSYLDILDVEYYDEGFEAGISDFDKYAFKEFLQTRGDVSRLTMYAEYLEWLKRNDVCKLFKVTACDINAIIETIMNCQETFTCGNEMGVAMRFVKQEMLQQIIKSRHNINIEQTNISKDMEIIEQRLLDHLLYSLNYRIGKAAEGTDIYKKESERCLYELDKKAYIKIFSRSTYEMYDKSIGFVSGSNSVEFDSYFREIKKYEDMVTGIVSLEKGKKKYDMVNLILGNNDLVDNESETLLNIAKTVISYYQKEERKYRKNELSGYKIAGLTDWEKGCWEAELGCEVLKIKLWSNRDVKNPIRHSINKEKLMVYCGCMNLYLCNIEDGICYSVPRNKRIISKSNRKHEIFICNVA